MSKILQLSGYRNRKLHIKPSILIKISKIARIVTIVFVLSLMVLLLCKVIKFKAKHFILTIAEERKILKHENEKHKISADHLLKNEVQNVSFYKGFQLAKALRILRDIDKIAEESEKSRDTGSSGHLRTVNYLILYLLRNSLCNPKIYTAETSNDSVGVDSKIQKTNRNVECIVRGKCKRFLLLTANIDSSTKTNGTNTSATGIAFLLSLLEAIKTASITPKFTIKIYFISNAPLQFVNAAKNMTLLQKQIQNSDFIFHLHFHTLATPECIPQITLTNHRIAAHLSSIFQNLFASASIENNTVRLKGNSPILAISCKNTATLDNYYFGISKNSMLVVTLFYLIVDDKNVLYHNREDDE